MSFFPEMVKENVGIVLMEEVQHSATAPISYTLTIKAVTMMPQPLIASTYGRTHRCYRRHSDELCHLVGLTAYSVYSNVKKKQGAKSLI